MCKPIVVEDIPNNVNQILSKLIREISKAQGCLTMQPKFIYGEYNPDQRLMDVESNAEHCNKHLSSVFQLTLKLRDNI